MKNIIYPTNFGQRVLRRAMVNLVLQVVTEIVILVRKMDGEQKKEAREITEGIRAFWLLGMSIHWIYTHNNKEGKS